jgi:hypothetical protein
MASRVPRDLKSLEQRAFPAGEPEPADPLERIDKRLRELRDELHNPIEGRSRILVMHSLNLWLEGRSKVLRIRNGLS